MYFQCIITASVNHFNLQSQTSEKLHFLKVVFVLLLLFFIHITEEDHLLLLQSEGRAVLLLLLDQSDGRQIPVWGLLLTVVQRLWPLRSLILGLTLECELSEWHLRDSLASE